MIDSLTWWMWGIIALDLAVAVAAICVLRYGAGLLFGVDTRDELAEKDNFAFGIALAGGMAAVALILAGAVSGEASVGWLAELRTVVVYAVVGLVLLKLGILINDALIFHSFSIRTALGEQNVAAGTVQAANLLALGVLINGAIGWAEGVGWVPLLSVAIVFFLSQIVLLGVTRLRSAIYARRHDGERLQLALAGGNVALAVRYAGHLLGTALAASSASGVVAYLPGEAGRVRDSLRHLARLGGRSRRGVERPVDHRAARRAAGDRLGGRGRQSAEPRGRRHRSRHLRRLRTGDRGRLGVGRSRVRSRRATSKGRPYGYNRRLSSAGQH